MHRSFSVPIVATFALAIATFGLASSVPVRAQTYDPSYPVCMQIYGPVGYFDCRYTSLQQCQYLAVGRSASMCALRQLP